MKRLMTVGTAGLIGLLAAGCAASIKSAKTQDADPVETRIAQLETQVGALNQQIDEINSRSASVAQASDTRRARSAKSLSNRDIQLALRTSGHYDGPIDGKIGSKTTEAVKAFQKAQGLTPDGKVGSKTSVALAQFLGAEKE